MDSFVWGLIREDADLKVLLPFYSTVEEHIIYCEQANEWTKEFFSEYIEHEVAYYAAHTACENICKKYPNSPHGINSIEVIDTTED